jgi:hypothetical protein
MHTEPNIPVRVDYNGNMVDMLIQFNESKFCIVCRNQLIAEIASNEKWEQVSGEALPLATFETIVNKIIMFYE